MNEIFKRQSFKREVLTGLMYWAFWTFVFAFFFAGIQHSVVQGVGVATVIIFPLLVPVHILSWLFNWFFLRKKIVLFFLIAIPFAWVMGWIIDQLLLLFMADSNITTSYGILIFIFTAMYIGFRYTRLAISQRILLKEEENKRVLSELQLLRSQLNPHFLFNALNNIYSLIISKSDKAGEAVLSLSELMRFHIASSGKQTITLKKEFEMISQYISLEKMRLSSKCSITVDATITNENIEIAPLIFMPFVENAFKYSISNTASANFISLRLSSAENTIDFSISNSIAKNINRLHENGSGMGIENTRKRLDLHYGNNHRLDINNTNDEFTVQLKIMLDRE
jgi:LytS/YehU family sensor histidine kinase